jgi:hypothetical protein
VAASNADLQAGRWLWDSGKLAVQRSYHHSYAGPALRSRQRCFWQVRVWDEHDQPSAWSEAASWEMGLLDERDWQAAWIAAGWEEAPHTSPPAPLLRREFRLRAQPVSARLYATSQGVYTAHLNGQRVSDWFLTPGWTAYQHRFQYQTYDVTALLPTGPNAVAAMLGDGWCRGYLGSAAAQLFRQPAGLAAAAARSLCRRQQECDRQRCQLAGRHWPDPGGGPLQRGTVRCPLRTARLGCTRLSRKRMEPSTCGRRRVPAWSPKRPPRAPD